MIILEATIVRAPLVAAAVALLERANRWAASAGRARARRGLQPQASAREARYGAVATAHTVSTATGSIANQTDVNSPPRHTTQLSTASDLDAGST